MNFFSDRELSCKCGKCESKFKISTIEKLNGLRSDCGFPFIISSGYRCSDYNKQIGATQTHATGQAVDILCSHIEAFEIITKAQKFGFTGIGVKQKGNKRFIHLDDLSSAEKRPRPHIWSY